MYFLKGPQDAVATLVLLATPYMRTGSGPHVGDAKRLSAAYRAYLDGLGGPRLAGEGPEVRIIENDREAAELARAFGMSREARGSATTGESRTMPAWKADLCRGGLDQLAAYNPSLAQLFQLVVQVVFSTQAEDEAAGSMTSAKVLGAVWVGPRQRWMRYDIAEAYVHEMTHILLTLDEHRFGHYRNYGALMEEGNLCESAIRQEPRPLNAVIHSIVVSHELIRLRQLPGVEPGIRLHEDSETMKRRARAGYESVMALPNLEQLCTDRMIELLEDLGSALYGVDAAPVRG